TGYDMERMYACSIANGEFSLRVPYACWLEVDELVLDGKQVRLDFEQRYFDTTPEVVTLAVPLAAATATTSATRLHVLDAETKAELSHVEIATGGDWMQEELIHPGAVGPDRLLVKDGISPLALPMPAKSDRMNGRVVYWIRAEGHAWSRFEHDPSRGGERTVQLERACELSIHLEPRLDIPKAVLRVRTVPDVDKFIAEQRARMEQLTAEDLPPGAPSLAEIRRQFEEEMARLKSGDGMQELINELGRPIAE